MLQSLISHEPVNTGRQREIDLVKAFCILMMIICHCIEELFEYSGANILAVIIREYENQTMGAQAFMICMGIGIVYARKSEPKTHLKRGLSLIIVGQVLNLMRYGLPNAMAYLISGNVYYRKIMFLVFSSDIMQFAGLTFILLGLFGALRFSELTIFIASIVMNIVGMALAGRVHTGSYIIDQLLGFFIATESESYFPLFHWFIYPAFGMVFGVLLKRVKDKKKFYLTLLIPTGILTVLYFYVAACVEQPFFLVIRDLEAFNRMNIADALMQLVCNTFLIATAFFVTELLPDRIMKGVGFISGNINRFYCVQWVLIASVDVIFSALTVTVAKGYQCYLIGVLVILLTWAAVRVYSDSLVKKVQTFIEKRKTLCYGLVIAASVAVCAWGYGAGLPLPNFMNNYLD